MSGWLWKTPSADDVAHAAIAKSTAVAEQNARSVDRYDGDIARIKRQVAAINASCRHDARTGKAIRTPAQESELSRLLSQLKVRQSMRDKAQRMLDTLSIQTTKMAEHKTELDGYTALQKLQEASAAIEKEAQMDKPAVRKLLVNLDKQSLQEQQTDDVLSQIAERVGASALSAGSEERDDLIEQCTNEALGGTEPSRADEVDDLPVKRKEKVVAEAQEHEEEEEEAVDTKPAIVVETKARRPATRLVIDTSTASSSTAAGAGGGVEASERRRRSITPPPVIQPSRPQTTQPYQKREPSLEDLLGE